MYKRQSSKYGDYQLNLNFDKVADSDQISGNTKVLAAVITTIDGTQYGLRHVENIWKGTEFAWGTGFTTQSHGCPISGEHYASMMGKTIDAVTYYTDNKKGIVHNYYSRTNKINYLLAKWMAVFITGGMTAIIPLMVNLMATSAVLPSFIALDYIISCNANGMWSYILYSHPYIYYILSFILQFICAGLIATVSLLISCLLYTSPSPRDCS